MAVDFAPRAIEQLAELDVDDETFEEICLALEDLCSGKREGFRIPLYYDRKTRHQIIVRQIAVIFEKSEGKISVVLVLRSQG